MPTHDSRETPRYVKLTHYWKLQLVDIREAIARHFSTHPKQQSPETVTTSNHSCLMKNNLQVGTSFWEVPRRSTMDINRLIRKIKL